MGYRILRPDTAFPLSDKSHKRIVDEKHLKFIRTLPSVISGAMGCDACHIRFGDLLWRKPNTPMSRKPDDGWTLPMTRLEHAKQHSMNEREFWKEQGIDALALAHELYSMSGDRDAAIQIIEKARR